MTTPNLNRVFTVSGASTQTVNAPIQWGADDRQSDSTFISATSGAWYADVAQNRGITMPDSVVLASGLVTFNPYLVGVMTPTNSPDGTDQLDVPPLNETLANMADRFHWMRVTTPDAGGAYVQFHVIRIFSFVDQPTISVMEVGQSGDALFPDPVLVGEDFALEPDGYVQFSFERHFADQTVETTFDKKVWGQLLERGSALGVVTVTTEETDALTASQEEALAIIRYNPSLAIGTRLVDDLGRQWTIEGSRSLEERRYLEYSLTRSVAAVSG